MYNLLSLWTGKANPRFFCCYTSSPRFAIKEVGCLDYLLTIFFNQRFAVCRERWVTHSVDCHSSSLLDSTDMCNSLKYFNVGDFPTRANNNLYYHNKTETHLSPFPVTYKPSLIKTLIHWIYIDEQTGFKFKTPFGDSLMCKLMHEVYIDRHREKTR